MTLFALYIFAYVLGSVPFAVIFGRIKGVDVLTQGSGNPGMTNVKRLLGAKWGYACFVLDVLKGLIPTLVAQKLIPGGIGVFDSQLVWFSVGFFAIIGHCCSIFLRFKGGKGVSTALGAIVGTCPLGALCCFSIFLIVLIATRYMALASVVGIASGIPVDIAVPGMSLQLLPIFIFIVAYVAYRHRKNFERISQGIEPKFSFGSRAEDKQPPQTRQPDEGAGNEPLPKQRLSR